MKEHFPILMWADMFRTSPQFAYLYGPKEIVLAIELCMQGDPSPWKSAQLAIEDMNRQLPLANRPHQVKGSKKRPKPDTRSETTTWSETSPWQDWSASGGTWAGWASFPLQDQDQVGGTIKAREHPLRMRHQAFRKTNQTVVAADGKPKTTDNPEVALQHRKDGRPRFLHPGGHRARRNKEPETQLRKAGG